jgi:Uma2 family endonuclease
MTAAMPLVPSRDPGPRGFTVADLHQLPEEGPRYELIDGSIIVSPSATASHNVIARWIAAILEDANPTDQHFVSTDQSTKIDNRNEPRPDIVVAPAEHLERTPFPIEGTLLVAEVVAPTSVLHDTETKRGLYARARVPAYWIVVPDTDKAAIALAELVLDGSGYRFVTHYTTGVFTTDRPWPVAIDLPALAQRWARLLRHAPTEE